MAVASTLLGLAVLFSQRIAHVIASYGDSSFAYHKCLHRCDMVNCTGTAESAFIAKQPFYMHWLGWTCFEECGYMCMWVTVEAFQRDGTQIPQFYGKWPFVRLFGIQEPASVVFSLLNALPHFIMMFRFRKTVPSSAPMYYIWHINALVGINAWFWSTVFHARDFPFTEMMDYIGAISLVMFSIFVLCVRLLGPHPTWKLIAVSILLGSFFVYHVHYMAFIKFDYGYNMKALITVGVINCIGWLVWCSYVKKKQPYAWKMALAISCINVLILLEVFDFPPLWWTFDAHSIWHASTSPLSFLIYSFAADDCLYRVQMQKDLEHQLPHKKAQ